MRGRSIDPYSYPHPNVVMAPVVVGADALGMYHSEIGFTDGKAAGDVIIPSAGTVCNGAAQSVHVDVSGSGTAALDFTVRLVGENQFREPITEDLRVYHPATGAGHTSADTNSQRPFARLHEIHILAVATANPNSNINFGMNAEDAGTTAELGSGTRYPRWGLPFRVQKDVQGETAGDSTAQVLGVLDHAGTVNANCRVLPQYDAIYLLQASGNPDNRVLRIRMNYDPGNDF